MKLASGNCPDSMRCSGLVVFIAAAFVVGGPQPLSASDVDQLTATSAKTSSKASSASDSSPSITGTAGPQSEPSRPYRDSRDDRYRSPTPEELEREPRLRARATQRWQHLIDGDYDATYEFTTPEYQESVERRKHAASFGDMVNWHLASIQDVRYDDVDQAEVVVTLTLSFPLGGEMVKTQIPISERWIYESGDWYHKAPASNTPLLDQGATGSD